MTERKQGRPKLNRSVERLCYPSEGRTGDRKHDRQYDRERRAQRSLQDAGIAWLCGQDTPEAKLFNQFVLDQAAVVKERQRRAAAGADPLNLTGHKPTLSKKKQKKADDAARIARGERHDVIPDPDHPNQNVLVTTKSHALRRVKALKIHHQAGAERFVGDWESAYYSGLRSQDFEPRVDSSPKAHVGHLRSVEAQKRLQMCERKIGSRNFTICKGVLIFNLNPTKVHAAGGRQHTSISADIEVAFNSLAEFYDPVRMAKDPTWRAFLKLMDEGGEVIKRLSEDDE